MDLVVLVADKEIERVVRAALQRPKSLGVRPIRFRVLRHPAKDAGCRHHAVEALRDLRNQFAYALVVFDRDGSGSIAPRSEVERDVEDRLHGAGWRGRSGVVVIEPELEAWLWVDSPAVCSGLGWNGSYASLRAWLEREKLWDREVPKPHDPKAAREHVLEHTGIKLAAKEIGHLAARVTLRRCQDPAFLKLRGLLQLWFPPQERGTS